MPISQKPAETWDAGMGTGSKAVSCGASYMTMYQSPQGRAFLPTSSFTNLGR
jgi:hypothetical protein